MKTKVRLNCYFFSNLIVGLLSLNLIFSNEAKTLVAVNEPNNGKLEAIYVMNEDLDKEKEEVVEISDATNASTISVSKKVVASKKIIPYVKPSYNSVTGSNLVSYAKHYLGLPYVHAGSSLETGTDCSGFTRLIYREFEINLGRTVESQLYSGTYVSKNDLQPGDLVFYGYSGYATHVTIYMGGGMVIHESTPRDGVKISPLGMMPYITSRRLITANVVSKDEKVEPSKEEVVPESQVKNEDLVVDNKDQIMDKQEEILDSKKEELSDNVNTNLESQVKEENKETDEELKNENVASNEITQEIPNQNENLDKEVEENKEISSPIEESINLQESFEDNTEEIQETSK